MGAHGAFICIIWSPRHSVVCQKTLNSSTSVVRTSNLASLILIAKFYKYIFPMIYSLSFNTLELQNDGFGLNSYHTKQKQTNVASEL
jgi:hypothetical protein